MPRQSAFAPSGRPARRPARRVAALPAATGQAHGEADPAVLRVREEARAGLSLAGFCGGASRAGASRTALHCAGRGGGGQRAWAPCGWGEMPSVVVYCDSTSLPIAG
ncbi:hypothetical protein SCWH03_09380 [Streptomyces pacificus]|uniref:Uncharacterized protein n=1 Tax=Streptomyces pacificus TaxID=2705029 RepID=A0A6A0AS14_9ACTN|nr:hypothetical protein SCWH03_09380 [Streptomyces pacificus]